ncbi:MAG: sulfatase [Herbinix sp.]|nr:sulfatase [Herbinix sp.]
MKWGVVMKAIMVMFDSLNKRFLNPYGCQWTKTPNFQRLAERTATFNNCYAGSLPCMPARRELHTGRYNFLHRSWSPLEPFDDSMPEILKKNGVYTHLVSDHTHYWEDGGATYHTRYNSWEIARGQEGDPWKGSIADPYIPESTPKFKVGDLWRQDWINRTYLKTEEEQPQAVIFQNGLDFIEKNIGEDNWFLQIESFDPHEPFFTQEKYKKLYPHFYDGKHNDWPDYGRVYETENEVEHVRYEYAALVSMCDHYLGKVLDRMDTYDLWKDTMLIVNTDHGFLLGEKEYWGKNVQPFYNEILNTPLFIWDPRTGVQNVTRDALVQTIDLPATLLEFFEQPLPQSMEGRPLRDTIISDQKVRDCALFGMFGGHVNITDGRFVYMRAPKDITNSPLCEYTLMPTHMNCMFSVNELQNIQLQKPFDFTKNCSLMKLESNCFVNPYWYGTLLFDLENDPNQVRPYRDVKEELRLIELMRSLMLKNDAPEEQYIRIGIPQKEKMTTELYHKIENEKKEAEHIDLGMSVDVDASGRKALFVLLHMVHKSRKEQILRDFLSMLEQKQIQAVSTGQVYDFIHQSMPGREGEALSKRLDMMLNTYNVENMTVTLAKH